jgi:membrane-bound lytic murein transglycosylase B
MHRFWISFSRLTAGLVVLLMLVAVMPPRRCLAGGQTAEQARFEQWLVDFRAEAAAAGISEATLNSALAGLQPLPKILAADQNQPEFKRSLDDYLGNAINDARIDRGRKLLRENWKLLTETAKNFPVQSRFLVALWGIETNFGSNQGTVSIIQALATLAYDKRRSAYFRSELLSALHIIDRDLVSLEELKGSWAGAMGQVQFMPSVYLHNAVDFDRNGRIDIRGSTADALASAANYLAKLGWKSGWTWGREVRLPDDFDPELDGLEIQLRLDDWRKLGVRQKNGAELPRAAIRASLIRPDGPDGRAFLVYDNYRRLLNWNRSHKFAIAVGLLADRIGQP